MILQRASELAIRAGVFLAQQAPGKLSPVHEIAEHTGASPAYLAKVLQRLTSAGIVRSFRGPGKGMRLAQPAVAITLDSLVRAVGSSSGEYKCVLGLGTCSNENPCGLHKQWVPIRTAIQTLLQNTTLADLVVIAQDQAKRTDGPVISGKNSFVEGLVHCAGRLP